MYFVRNIALFQRDVCAEQVLISGAAADKERKLARFHHATLVRQHQREILALERKHEFTRLTRLKLDLLKCDQPLDWRENAAHEIAYIHLRRLAARARAGVAERNAQFERLRIDPDLE